MTTPNAPAATSSSARTTAARPRPASWPWRRSALLLAIAAQLITISALVSADPIRANWASLLLAIAPAPLAAAAAYAPARLNWVAAIAGVLVLIAGIAGGIGLTGVFFAPALVAFAVSFVLLWRRPT